MLPLPVDERRTQQSPHVHAVVRVEAPVFGGDQRLLKVGRHLIERNGLPVLLKQLGDHRMTVAGVQDGLLRRWGLDQVARLVEELAGLVVGSQAQAANVREQYPGGQQAHNGNDAGQLRDRTCAVGTSGGAGHGDSEYGRDVSGPVWVFHDASNRPISRSPSRSWTSVERARTDTTGTSGCAATNRRVMRASWSAAVACST